MISSIYALYSLEYTNVITLFYGNVCLGFVTNLSWFLPSVGPPTYDQATAPFLPSPADPFTWQVSAESAAKSAMESLLGQSLAQTKAGVACLLSSDPRPFVVV